MNHVKVKEMIQFSFYKNMQNKWFIIFNLITLLSVVVVMNWGNLASLFQWNQDEKTFQIAVLDKENLVYDSFVTQLSGEKKYEISRLEANEYTAETIPNDLMVIEVEENAEEAFQVAIISKEGINIEWYNPVYDTLFAIRNELLEDKYGVQPDTLEILQRKLMVNRIMLSVEAEDSSTKEMVKLFSSALTYLITVFIFSKMSNEIASEKQSKATEYILTTVSAKEYLFAKIFSNIAILILQGLLMLVYYFIGTLLLSVTRATITDFSLSASMTTYISKDMVYYVLALIGYNVLNLILLCIVQAAIASKTSSTSEAGNAVSLLLFVMMAAYIATVYFLRPYTKVNLLLYLISCLPLLSAYFVPGMMVIGQATTLQIFLSLVILILAIPVTFHYCAKVFKNGILDYTKMKNKKSKSKTEEEAKKEFWNKREMKKFGFVIGVAIILYVGVQTIFSLLGSLVLPTIFENQLGETEINLLLQIILQVLSLGLAYAFVASYSRESEKKVTYQPQFSIKTKVKIVLIALFLVFALQLLLSLLLYPAIGLDYDTTDLFQVNADSSLASKIILVIALAVTPGFFEELFFRKGIINFSIRYGKTFALLFSALFFGLLHMNLSQGLFAFLMGLLLGAIYIETGDIRLTMLIHFLNNGVAALELILPEMGGMIAIATLMIGLLIGFVLLVKELANKEQRGKIISLCKTKVNLQAFQEKYQYIFTEYTFDVALLLIFCMSLMTEKILR